MKGVLLAVPTRERVTWQTVTRLEQIRDAHPGLPPILYQPGNLSVAMTRNRIVQAFLATTCETLVMVDDDVVVPPAMLERLLPMPAGFGIVAIPHVMPHPSEPGRLFLTAYQAGGDVYTPYRLAQGWNTVDAVATGCVAITRFALEALGPHPFRITHDPTAAITSDDFLFCADLKAAGFKVGCWHDGWHCDHISTVGLAPLYERHAADTV